ncbi:MAG TPA: FAD-containing oxidoreductase [Burkholderiales bacterium]|nr:FAD-containing oxidoreductase [Burkholderiales bacterium]
MHRFDAIVIGTGQAGPSMAARLAAKGMRVAVIERARFGGTCVNTGCIPTKALVASAYVAHKAREASHYGVEIDAPVRVDMKKVKARKDDISGQSRDAVEAWMRSLEHCVVYQGHARFTGPRTVSVNGETLHGERIFINVGARPLVPDMPGVRDVPFLTSDSMMDVDFAPKHLLIVGGSYIGLEFGQMYRRFGSEVTIVEKAPRLIGREDPDVSDTVADILQGEGIALRLSATCLSLEPDPQGAAIQVECAEGAPRAAGSHVLLAVGRAPNTDDLGLDAAGIRTDKRGYIEVADDLETSVPGVYALGDCNGRGAFTHTAYNDYEIVAANLLDGAQRRVTDRITSYALFIDPPLGRIGMTDAEAREAVDRVLVGKRPMTRVGRAVQKGEPQGFMKITVDADSRRILGAAIFGVAGDEVVHSLIDVLYARMPYEAVQRAVRIHPTVSELIPTTLEDLQPLG